MLQLDYKKWRQKSIVKRYVDWYNVCRSSMAIKRRSTMNIINKTLVTVVSIVQILSLTAGAATIESVNTDSGYVIIKGTTDEEVVTYKIHSKNSSGNLVSDICEMGESDVEDGRFLIKVKMPKSVRGVELDGDYVVTVTGNVVDSGEFYVVSHSSKANFIDKLDGSSIATASDLVGLFEASEDGGYANLDIMKNLGADVDYCENRV